MKKLLFAACLSLFILSSFAQESKLTTIVVVRHAEKANDGSKDPALTELGAQRALRLKAMISSKVTAVYSTNYVRTTKTVEPIAKAHGLPVGIYDPRDGEAINKIIASNVGGIIVIVGHSNTVPGIINKLIGEEKYAQLSDSEYDKIFIITVDSGGTGKELVLIY